MAYPVGQSLNVTHEYLNTLGALTDGTTVTATVVAPNGTSTVYTYGISSQYVRVSTGVYRLTFTGTAAGTWRVTGDAEGPALTPPLSATTTDTYAFAATVVANDWVQETLGYLEAGSPRALNKLAAGVDSATETLSFIYDLNGIGPGTTLSIGTEDLHVWEVNTTAKTATVRRGHGGSTADIHAVGDVVEVNPDYTAFTVLRALNQEIMALASDGLFAVKTVDLTYNPSIAGYDLTDVAIADLVSVYSVEYRTTWLTGDWRPTSRYRFGRDQLTSDFPSGGALWVDEGQPGQLVRVVYKTGFHQLADLQGDVEDTLIPDSAWDIPPLGAAARLAPTREIGRNDTSTQGDSRRSAEVPAGAIARSALGLQNQRHLRVAAERANQNAMYPVLSSYRRAYR